MKREDAITAAARAATVSACAWLAEEGLSLSRESKERVQAKIAEILAQEDEREEEEGRG